MPPRSPRNRRLARIHAAWKETGLDDFDYRHFLHRITGRDSCKGLSIPELDSVIRALTELQPAPPRKDPRWRTPAKQAQARLIYRIWWKLGEFGEIRCDRSGYHRALRLWLQAHYGVSAPEFLSPTALARAADTLKQWEGRVRRALAQRAQKAIAGGEAAATKAR